MDAEAFAAAYVAHRARIERYCMVRLGDPDVAADVAQAVWLEAWERRGTYEDRGHPITAWLYPIARSRCVDRGRVLSRWRLVPLVDIHPAPDPIAAAETRVAIAAVLAAVATPAQRQALALRAAGYTLAEVAAAMGLTLGATKALIHRGMEAVRRAAREEPDGSPEANPAR